MIEKKLPLLPTIILRHRKENLKKCSLRGLETRSDMQFFTYPKQSLPPLTNYVLLDLEGPLFAQFVLSRKQNSIKEPLKTRSPPKHIKTAYPRRQPSCDDPERGLASVEALFIAYQILGYSTDHLLDHYHCRDQFLLP